MQQNTETAAVWQEPEDGSLLWVLDRIHAADPITPLELSLAVEAYNPGFTRGARSCGLPIARVESRRINGYLYSAFLWDEGEDGLDARMAALRQAIADLPANWDERWLPEIRGHLAAWEAFGLAAADEAALAEHLRASLPRLQRLFELHFAVTVAATAAVSLFEELFDEIAGGELAWTAYDLLRGFDNRSVQRDLRLQELARRVRSSPELARTFARCEGEELLARCSHDGAAGWLRDELDRFLGEFGAASDRPRLVAPTWSEQPLLPLLLIRSLVLREKPGGAGGREEAVRAREAAVAETRLRARGFPLAVREELELLLRGAQTGNVLLEDHAFWIDQKVLSCLRRLLLEIGRRHARSGRIDAAEDVFLLPLDELLAPAGDGGRWREEAARRRAEMAAWAALAPPPFLGTPAWWPGDDPILRALGKVAGGGPPPEPAEPSMLYGSPAAAGQATGEARLVTSVADAARLRPGDVLVAAATLPSWTPLFALAAGLVTDEGGVLCHSACVAREYGLPAVVGTGDATRRIRDGRRIAIDGSQGTVRLL